jgi:predicted O-methyltransferase YrrM
MAEASLAEYVSNLLGGEDETLRSMREEAEREGLPAIQVPFELGRLLQVLIVRAQATSVLEIGTLFGYSTVLMARVLPKDGRITTLEVSPKHADIARRNYDRAGVAGVVDVRVGPALDSLRDLDDGAFDFVFIDADKRSYPDYLDHALRLTRGGGTIVADNVWRGGGALAAPPDDPDNAGIFRFNRRLAQERRLLTAIVPTRDGRDAASISVVRG